MHLTSLFISVQSGGVMEKPPRIPVLVAPMTWALSLHCVWSLPDSSLQLKTRCVSWGATHPKEFYRVNITAAAGLSGSCFLQLLKSTGIYVLQLHRSNFCFHDYLAFLLYLKLPPPPSSANPCGDILHPPGKSTMFSLTWDFYLHHLCAVLLP